MKWVLKGKELRISIVLHLFRDDIDGDCPGVVFLKKRETNMHCGSHCPKQELTENRDGGKRNLKPDASF